MKNLLIVFLIIISTGIANAQIAEVKQDGKVVKVFDENGKLNATTQICSSCRLGGYSSKYFVIVDGKKIQIYNYDAKFKATVNNTGSFERVNVTSSYVIVTADRKSMYYNFDGKFVKSN